MSKKRGETKMMDVMRAVADVAEYEAKSLIADHVVEAVGRLVVCDVAKVIMPDRPRARSRTFVAKPCSVCQALREPDTNFTRVYASRGNIRYCRCSYCGNTWKDQG